MYKTFMRGVSLAAMAATLVTTVAPTMAFAADRSESAPRYTKSYMIDFAVRFDDAGNMRLTQTELTATQSRMLVQIDAHCVAQTKKVKGYFYEQVSRGGKTTLLGALGTAVGAVLGFPNTKFLEYFKYGAGSYGGSSIASTDAMWNQNKSLVHGMCVMRQVDHINQRDRQDGRLENIIIIMMYMGKAIRPPTNDEVSHRIDSTEAPDTDREEPSDNEDDSTATPVVPM